MKNFLSNFIFLPKFFCYLPFFENNKKLIRPYFGINLFKKGGPYIRSKRIIKEFGNHIFSPNIIYAQSFWTVQELSDAVIYAKKKNIPIIFNQNGWFYSAWNNNFKVRNKAIVNVHKVSDLVLYQSNFCRKASLYLNNYVAPNNKIMFNDVPNFNLKKKSKFNNFLLSGIFDNNSDHILFPALRSFEYLHKTSSLNYYKCKLIIAGVFKDSAKKSHWYERYKELLNNLINKNICEFRGEYDEENFNKKFSDVTFSLHLKYKDPCPNAVIERIKKGIIHIYSNSGGTPELIKDSGVKINVKNTWSKLVPVNYKVLSKKIIFAIKNKKKLYTKTLLIKKKFSYNNYIKKHKIYFRKIIKNHKIQ
jgi:hypothetical protein